MKVSFNKRNPVEYEPLDAIFSVVAFFSLPVLLRRKKVLKSIYIWTQRLRTNCVELLEAFNVSAARWVRSCTPRSFRVLDFSGQCRHWKFNLVERTGSGTTTSPICSFNLWFFRAIIIIKKKKKCKNKYFLA
jgi:hypothetical protein